ncbi:fucolectin-related molecule [Plakobranchus ocellatus]|uniref:Fucolectin-related molecule n=1 Tax=Plakobranchus ocellatus TaxID=259542 RepID=A0AAV4ABB5_9GAST|nr:fucolectin-related molecule [Plakobranchus ocellatus]
MYCGYRRIAPLAHLHSPLAPRSGGGAGGAVNSEFVLRSARIPLSQVWCDCFTNITLQQYKYGVYQCRYGVIGLLILPSTSTVNAEFTPPTRRNSVDLKSWQDRNHNTCQRTSFRQDRVSIKLKETFAVTWLRIVGKNAEHIAKIKIESEARSAYSCRTAKLDSKTVDFVCSDIGVTDRIILSNLDGIKVCEIYISKGRNVALHQATTQSSTFYGWGPENAVNGNLGTIDGYHFELSTECTHTNEGDSRRSFWRVTFSHPMNIIGADIYNRRNPSMESFCCEQRLIGFTLTVYDGSDRSLYSYTDPRDHPLDVYHILFDTVNTKQATAVEIDKSKHSDYLTLCENRPDFQMKAAPYVLQAERKSTRCLNSYYSSKANEQTAQKGFLPSIVRVTCMAFGHSCEVKGFLYIASPQQGDLRLSGSPSGQGSGGGARTRVRRVQTDLRADS